MKSKLPIILLVALVLGGFICKANGTAETEAAFATGNAAYQKKDYKTAASCYERAFLDGNTAPELEFNLGNAYYKSGRNAEAILHYERALKLNPSDEEILYNIRVASLKNTDRIDVIPEIFYKRWMNTAVSWMSERSWSWVFLVLCCCLFTLIALFFTGKSNRNRRLYITLAMPVMLLILLTGAAATERKSIEYDSTEAIIMNTSVYVKSSPDEKGNDLFILHDGTKVYLMDELGGWKKIRIANGAMGWLPESSIAVI